MNFLAHIELSEFDLFIFGCIWTACFIPCLIYHIIDILKNKKKFCPDCELNMEMTDKKIKTWYDKK